MLRQVLTQTTVLAFLLAVSLSTRASEQLAILPASFTLTGKHAQQPLLVQQLVGEEYARQLTDGLSFSTSDPRVVTVDNGVARAVANGQATITARINGKTVAAKVLVANMNQPHEWSFRNHVLPVMSKIGCNSGACHGALAGKGGFKLSLRGYDPETDHFTITRQARGRRIELVDPGRSLLLAKPSGAIPHKGGLRLETNCTEYQILSAWIAGGAAPPRDDDPQLKQLEILPQRCVLKPGVRQQFLVRAHYDDGRVEDVTRWAKFTSASEAVATIDPAGQVFVIGHGEGAVTAWFSSKIAIARVTSPFDNEIDEDVFAKAERRNLIDHLVLKQLKLLNLPPSPPATDNQFIRRAFIDTIGTLPTAEEVRRFLADASSDKRDALIEMLLGRTEFVDYWTYKWSDILLINGQKLRPKAVQAYYQWVRQHVAKNTRWDEFVREIVTAQGSSHEQGATNFYAVHQDPESMTENVCQAFLGLSIGCARCHNHPLEKWTNDQYYAMANLFARVRAKGWGGDARSGDGMRTVYIASKGDLIQSRTGKPQPPTPLDGDPIPFDDPTDRRVHLAKWLTSASNPYFARSITNRVWANFFGVGLIEQVDDMRDTNPASNEELLTAVANYLVQHRFDLKELMRLILQSETYQRSSQSLPENEDEKRFYCRYYPRRMMAEVLLDAIAQVTEVPTDFSQVAFVGTDLQKTDFYPLGTRAIQLYDSAVVSYFLKTFGRNERMITCDCERSDEPSMVQVLHLSNGNTINEKLKAKNNRIDKLFSAKLPNYKMIEEVYLSALARYPTDTEMQELLKLLNEATADIRRSLMEDIFWGILSSREFLFNH